MVTDVRQKLIGVLIMAFSLYLLSVSFRLPKYSQDSLSGIKILVSQDVSWAAKKLEKQAKH